jgi:hypothetical protein
MPAVNPNKETGFIVEEHYVAVIEAHGKACPANAGGFKGFTNFTIHPSEIERTNH